MKLTDKQWKSGYHEIESRKNYSMNSPILFELPIPIKTPRLVLRHCMPGDGKEVNAAIQASFAELTQWMPWAEKMPSEADSEIFCREAYAKWILREDLSLSIFSGAKFIGRTGLHRMNWSVPSFEIGYWIRTDASKQGFMTEAVNAVTRYAFDILKAKRVEIKCDRDNTQSKKIPERLGFQYEGTLYQNELKCHGQGPRDTLVYARTSLQDLPLLEVKWG